MKNAVIIHGTECKPDLFWYPWLKAQLLKFGYEVSVPSIPAINQESVEETLKKVHIELNEETILIGHSAGSPFILSLLERSNTKVRLAVHVAGFSYELNGESVPILQRSYDFSKIKNNCKDFLFFNSTNDPWGCDHEQGLKMQKELGGTLIIQDEGHFGSTAQDQSYRDFPLLLKTIQGVLA